MLCPEFQSELQRHSWVCQDLMSAARTLYNSRNCILEKLFLLYSSLFFVPLSPFIPILTAYSTFVLVWINLRIKILGLGFVAY